jgi:quercetin dioxygenase-like cupin family protein
LAGNEQIELRPGLLVSLAPAVSHAVAAAEDEHLLLLVAVSEQITQQQP